MSATHSAMKRSWAGAVVGVLLAGAALLPAPRETAEAAASEEMIAGLPGFRRLSEAQYVRSIEHIFGTGIRIPGRFEPPLREDGLMAIGDSKVVVSASGIEQYELRAREIAAQVMADERREAIVPCATAAPAFDKACAQGFFGKYGRLLYRRPLTNSELAGVVGIADAATRATGSFAKGLEAGLTRLLVSPKFVFRAEASEPDPQNPALRRLDPYALATRISFLLWDAPPDAELLDAAARGDLRDEAKLGRHVDRLLASPRFEHGVRAFFSDMFGYERFDGLTKDQAIYPKFSSDLAASAKDQTLRTVIDHLVTRKGDYRDLFITKKTFINRDLGALYQVPVEIEGLDGWAPYTFAADDPRGGILSFAGFLMLDPTHEGRSSPTVRGMGVRELLLCQPVPLPPADVNFSIVQDVDHPLYKTARQRLTAHQENPVCAGCHAVTDPIGLSMENYDAIGNLRTHENGALIDASGSLDGEAFVGLLGLSKVLRDNPSIPSCLVQRTFEYGVGRRATIGEEKWLEATSVAFAEDKYRLPSLMRRIALSSEFRTVGTEPPLAPTAVTAAR
jgi:hypothetical protein